MQAAVLMYADDARAESGAGVTAELPWTRWAQAHTRDSDAPSATNSNCTSVSSSENVERVATGSALHKRPSAAAMALTRKRQRKRQQELGDSASEVSAEPDASEADADEEEITAFVEYNANDMDSLDINLSQDFDGEISVRGAAGGFRRRHPQPQAWTGSQDEAEEASEVFDNVIYAPLPSRTSAVPPPRVQQVVSKPVPHQSPLSEEDDDTLSDGFEIDPELANGLKQSRLTASPPALDAPAAASTNRLVWRQRRSIKRDCSFVDSDGVTNLSSTSGRVDASPRSSIKVVELDDDDDSIESIEACSLSEPTRVGPPTASAAPSSSALAMTSTSLVVTGRATSFMPRLQKKRRKVEHHQLTLDGFFGRRTPN